MKFKNSLTFLVFFIFSRLLLAQDVLTVSAKNGLFLRSQPNGKSEVIAKLAPGEKVKLLSKTDQWEKVNHNNQPLAGRYVQVKTSKNFVGYAFDGYLLKTNGRFGNFCDNLYQCIYRNSAQYFDFSIFDYEVYEAISRSDTLLLYEEVFREIGDHVVLIEPKIPAKKVTVFYGYEEALYPYQNLDTTQTELPQVWHSSPVFTEIKNAKANAFMVPTVLYDAIRESRAEQLNLQRVKDWEQGGEGGWIPRYIYKNSEASYSITSVLLRVEIVDLDGKTHSQLIKIELSYGC